MDDLPTQRVVADEGDIATVSIQLPQVEFNRYELVRELGKGGTGVVWLARDAALGTEVALKTLRPDITSGASALDELKAEVRINRTLTHPNIVKTFDFVTNGRASAISMEFVSGINLHRLKAERPLGFFEVEDISRWVLQLCSAMDYAHGRNVVHRDLKPANLMIDEAGELKVGDFGIGRTAVETLLTRNCSGTPPFMSPQQTMGERAVASDDIYSIGATIYDLLTGDPPFFRGAIREQALAKIAPPMTERRKELGRTGQAIPSHWEAAVAACLSKEAAGRPKTAAALRALLEAPEAPVVTPPRRRGWWKWALPLAVLAAAGTAAHFLNPRLLRAPAEPLRSLLARFSPTAPAPRPSAAAPLAPAGPPPAPAAASTSVSNISLPIRAPDAPPAPGGQLAPLAQLQAANQVSTDEADLLRRAAAGQFSDAERVLADRLLFQRSLTPSDWRNYSALTRPPDPIVEKLRPLLTNGAIDEMEFAWLDAALHGAKGDSERALAGRLVEAHDLTSAQWRAETTLYPPPPVDPVVEKIKPLFTSGLISADERSWLEDALRGKSTPREQALAENLVNDRSLTPWQWRARTGLAYPPPWQISSDPAKWPPATDLPLAAGISLRLMRIEPGLFIRGTPENEHGHRTNEPAPSQVRIDQPFYLGVTLVTQAEYTALMPRNPSYWRGHPNWPIDQVDWQSLTGQNGFLDRLNRLLRRHGSSALAADLPSDDEWEYAARAGTQSSFYQGGPISDLQRDPTLDLLANYNRSDTGSPQPVGTYAPNAWGLYDMLGNLSEWCRDRFIRGGSWQSNAAGCRIGWRTQSNQDSDTDPSPTQGFRLLLRARTPGA